MAGRQRGGLSGQGSDVVAGGGAPHQGRVTLARRRNRLATLDSGAKTEHPTTIGPAAPSGARMDGRWGGWAGRCSDDAAGPPDLNALDITEMADEAMMSPTCRICGDQQQKTVYHCREMHFGSRELFEYFECGACGCLQIAELPDNIGDHYPENYYSKKTTLEATHRSAVQAFLVQERLDSFLGNVNPLGRLLRWFVGEAYFDDHIAHHIPLRASYSILDVGCGNGKRMLDWHRCGFTRVKGLDPFINETIQYDNGVRIDKCEIGEKQGSYDLILAFHSLEHIWDQKQTLSHIHRLLKPQRYAMIEVPVIPSQPWALFGTNWLALDAPRHFYIHSKRSLTHVAEAAGFQVVAIHHAALSDQYWASIQYQNDIPLVDARSYDYGNNDGNHMFTADQIAEFEARTREDIEQGRSGNARFYLYKRV